MNDIDSRIAALADEEAERAREDFIETFEHLAHRCESPMEKLFLAGFVVATRGYEQDTSIGLHISFQSGDKCHHSPWDTGCFVAQAQLGEYRADFYLEMIENGEIWLRIAIECNGHEFHEKTKEQARRDKRRNRWMIINGIDVLHFTGAEIWEDPEECAHEVFRLIFRRGMHQDKSVSLGLAAHGIRTTNDR